MVQSAKNILKQTFKTVGLEVKRRQPPLTTLSLYERLYGEEATRERRFYNIGAGTFRHEAWTNVDNPSDWYRENFKRNPGVIEYDLQSLQALPIESNSAPLAYTSHCIEHIDTAAAAKLFEEVHRILKPGGVFRVTAPDMDLFFRAYRAQDREFFYWFEPYNSPEAGKEILLSVPPGGASLAQIFMFEFASTASEIHADGAPERISDKQLAEMFEERGFEATLDFCTSKCPPELQKKYPGNHINWWTKDKLVASLKAAGFSNVYVSGYGQSLAAPMRDTNYFDNTQPRISLYVEATK
jgi:SAM-dependent methyltransferase